MCNHYDAGQALASQVVDYIGAIPASFAGVNDRAFWQGFIDAERQRMRDGYQRGRKGSQAIRGE